MKASAKNFIKKQMIIFLMIIFCPLIITICFLGFYERDIEPLEKTMTISVSPEK
jgi:hypothetical protein